MGAKSPKITPAQRELEALQLRTLMEQEREQNVQGAETALLQRRMMLGQLGYNQFLRPGFNTVLPVAGAATGVPPAQALGTTVTPDLVDPAIAANERRAKLAESASGFGSTFLAATRTLSEKRRI